jgi:hypothetical protein
LHIIKNLTEEEMWDALNVDVDGVEIRKAMLDCEKPEWGGSLLNSR